MKKMKRIACIALSALMATSVIALSACGKGDENDKYKDAGKKAIDVSLYFGEFGSDWLKEIAKGFNETTTSNYYVEVTDHKNLSPTIVADIKTGTDKDVFIALDANFQMLYKDGYLEDLSDVLTEKPDGAKTVKDMIKDYDSWTTVAPSPMARIPGNRPSSKPTRNTWGNSRPLAECMVIITTASSPSLYCSKSVYRAISSRNPERLGSTAFSR